jgi:hypothetical protein
MKYGNVNLVHAENFGVIFVGNKRIGPKPEKSVTVETVLVSGVIGMEPRVKTVLVTG